ncbi:hypothetical protein FH972_026322 [Carpinus fangiana]|uniref:Peptidase S9 prolyl oligopeptidase catalytic domain-containing protein n=1 Tax=Carpinus fangiana TaxID=176857 RepID=A0A5N6L3M4_9ROSI|nr:hypothetical protein FH972_026322 [Carpinus fangiana]
MRCNQVLQEWLNEADLQSWGANMVRVIGQPFRERGYRVGGLRRHHWADACLNLEGGRHRAVECPCHFTAPQSAGRSSILGACIACGDLTPSPARKNPESGSSAGKMTIRASKFTPEVMLGAPRRSAGVPNSDASFVLYSVSTYDFEAHESSGEIRILDVEKNESAVVTKGKDTSNPLWLDDSNIALFRGAKEGQTELLIGPAKNFEAGAYVAGTIGGAADNLKITTTAKDQYRVAFSALANPDGSLYNGETAPKLHTTGKLYHSLYVRHWDTWIEPQRQAVWYASLTTTSEVEDASKTKVWSLSSAVNVLRGTSLECPMPPFGGGDHFDVGPKGVIFVAKDPDLDPALHTKCNVYVVPIDTAVTDATPSIYTTNMSVFKGAATSPRFSADGNSAAFLMMMADGYEADKNQLFTIPNIHRPAWIQHFLATDDGSGKWDQSPDTVAWSHDGRTLYLTAEKHGQKLLYHLPSNPAAAQSLPVALTTSNTVTSVSPLTDGSVFLTSSSIVDSSIYSLVNYTTRSPYVSQLSSHSHDGATFGLSASQVSDIWVTGAGKNSSTGDKVHAWVVKPSNFSKSRQYPLAFLVHGGPQGAWDNAWSTRWNPALFAEQGYVVVLPNPTGSTGYGQQFCDDIKENWGGTPYEDLVNCFEYIDEHLDYVDCKRAVALGASYGGYMMNWIQGHALGRKFKALVTHDGVFSTSYELATDEVYFINREFGRSDTSADRPNAYDRWDPAKHTDAWSTPHLIIHSELDYRLTMADGLAAFNVLQERGVESELLVFPDENHFVLKPENSLRWHETVFSFINRHVGLPTVGDKDLEQITKDPPRGGGRQGSTVCVCVCVCATRRIRGYRSNTLWARSLKSVAGADMASNQRRQRATDGTSSCGLAREAGARRQRTTCTCCPRANELARCLSPAIPPDTFASLPHSLSPNPSCCFALDLGAFPVVLQLLPAGRLLPHTMHFSRAFVAAAAIYLAPLALADDAATDAAAASSSEIIRPDFKPTELKAPFVEQFTDDWASRWQASHAKKELDGAETEEEWAFVGNWEVEEPIVYKGIEGDKGLVLKDKAAHHAISAKFPKAIDNKKKTLVVQYEVKLQDGLECGGAYMKLLQDNKKLKTDEFSNASPYVIMFGPDKCGSTNKVITAFSLMPIAPFC